jgi:hypothetical protein
MPHPYTTTIAGLVATIRQLRSTFPASVGPETLKKWSIASNNEAAIIVVLRFMRLIDEEGKKVAETAKAFVEHDDDAFARKFEAIVKAAYGDLFETWGDAAWALEKGKLIGFFRNADGSSARVGQEQANTFLALAGLAGHGPAPTSMPGATGKKTGRAKKSVEKMTPAGETARTIGVTPPNHDGSPTVTLRVEINLPVTDDQTVYDSIFKSIRAHLLNA